MGKLNILLNNRWVKEEIIGEITTYLENNKNKNKIYQNLWNAGKGVLREKFM